MKKNKQITIGFFIILLLGIPWIMNVFPQSTNFIDHIFSYVNNNLATVFTRESITINQLHNKYNSASNGQSKVRILIVPGHEPDFGGTEYRNLKERNMTVDLAKYLEGFLKNNSHYEVMYTRDKNSWNPNLQKYFTEHWNDIISFVKENRSEMLRMVNNGVVAKKQDGVKHNKAPQNVALRLYGINKWVNDNDIDIAIHIHFNDYPRNNESIAGEYSGFSIYVPERQYSNSTTTRAIANTVFKRLSKYNAVSNLPKEKSGVIEEQELIAIGVYNTLDAPSMLIEYGYIYESQFNNTEIYESTLKDLAFQTYLGIQDFFGSGNDVSLAYDTLMLPYNWKENIGKNNANKNNINDVLALQAALTIEGLYPSNGRTKNDCPRTGNFGPCTTDALNSFQKKYGITGESGIVGKKTKNVLNERYSVRVR